LKTCYILSHLLHVLIRVHGTSWAYWWYMYAAIDRLAKSA